MRSIWRGAITFGMVTIPIKLYSATEQKDVRFRLLHREDGAPIVEKRVLHGRGQRGRVGRVGPGLRSGQGEFVIMEPEEIEEAAPETTRTIEIGDFVQLEEIDPISTSIRATGRCPSPADATNGRRYRAHSYLGASRWRWPPGNGPTS